MRGFPAPTHPCRYHFHRYQHSGIGGRYLIQGFADGLHGRRGTPVHRTLRRYGLLRSGIPFHCLPGLIPGCSENLNQLLIIPRLHNEIKRTALHPFHRQCNISISSEEHHLHFRHHLLDLSGPVQSLVAGIDAGVEIHIQQHHIRPKLLKRTHKRCRRGDCLHLCEVKRQQDFQRPADTKVIIDYKNFPYF